MFVREYRWQNMKYETEHKHQLVVDRDIKLNNKWENPILCHKIQVLFLMSELDIMDKHWSYTINREKLGLRKTQP